MNERDRRIIEAMIGEADDWHIVDPATGAEIDQDGGIPVTSEQFRSLLAGESAVVGLTRRVVTLADGPFSIRGGPGSGHFGHEGRPGEVGGSLPSGEVLEEPKVAGGRSLRKTGNQEYAVEDNGVVVAYLYSEHRAGSPRELKRYIGAWRPYNQWVLDPGGDAPLRTFDTFREAKTASLAPGQSATPYVVSRGGPGSGHFGHEGRPGEVGGSLPSGEVAEEATAGGSPATRINTDFIRGNLWIEVGQEDFDAIADILRHFDERVRVPGERGKSVRYIPTAKVTAALTAADEFWLFPDGSVVATGRLGHEEVAEWTLARYFGEQTSRWSDGLLSVRRSTGFGGGEQLFVLRRPPGDKPHLLSEDVEIATGNIRENGSVEWWGYGQVEMGTTPTADVTPQQVIDLNPDIAATGLMRHTDREGLLAAFGMVRVSRGGTGGNEVGFSWDASLPPTEAQRRVLMHIANETMDSGGGFVYETLNQSIEHPGAEGVVESNTWSTARRAFAAAMAGNYAIQRSTLPDWALALTVRGGKGSGYTKAKGHKGRQGEVGGSEPSATGPEEHKPVKSKRKGQAMTAQARPAAYRMVDLLETILEESQAGKMGETASWQYLSSLASRNARSLEAKGGADSVPLVESQQTNLWLVYHGIQHMLNTSELRDGLDEDENASLQAVGDLLGDFEPDLPDNQVVNRYLGDETTPGVLPEEITGDPYLRYQAGRIVADFATSVEGSYLTAYNGTDESYLDVSRMMLAREEIQHIQTNEQGIVVSIAGGGASSDPEAWNGVVEAWRQRAVSDESSSEAALALRESPADPDFWAHNAVMAVSFGQWLPTDASPELYETADWMNAGWKASPQGSSGGVGVLEAASRVFGAGTVPGREVTADEMPDPEVLDEPQRQERANQIVQGMYDRTQGWLADRGYHPGDTVRLYRGMGNIEGSWNPLRGPGEGNVQMYAVSSWSFDHSVAESFTSAGATVGQTAEGSIIAADIPIERLLANSDTGVPCEREGEWLVLGMDGIRGRVYRGSDPSAAWELDIDPSLSPREVRAQIGQLSLRSAVCLGFLPVSLPAQVITAQGWREIAARQATAPDPSLPIINVEADGDWIGNKLGVYGLTRADVDGMGQPETGKESAQKGKETGKPGDEEKPKGKEGGAPNKEAGLRAYARAKRANRVRRERARAAGRQRLQSGMPAVVERGGEGSGHFGHEGRPGEVGGSAPSGHKTPETWQDMVAGFQWDAFTPEQIAAYRPGREAVTFFRKQAIEEMATLDPSKVTRQDFIGPDHYDLLTSAQIAMMGVDKGDILRAVLIGREYAREMVWKTAVRHQIALGRLDPLDAYDLGEHSSATSSSYRGTEGEYGISFGPWAPLPERLYHVTTAATGVARDGLLSRDDLNMELSPGLGGGESDTISFTTNFALAQDIDRALHEARMVANGEFTVAQMAEQARSGFAANQPFSEGLMPGLREGDASEESLDRFVAAEASATSPEDFAQDRWNFYQQFLGARQRAGGPANPVFFGTDYEALAQLDPADFTILEYQPRLGAMGYQVGGMSEWRTVGGDTVELQGQHESITPETEGNILGRTWRAIMRSRGVIARPHPLPKPKEPEKPKYAPRPDRQTYGTSIFNPQLREVVYAWPGSKGLNARAIFEKVARAQAAGNEDITGMVLGSYTEPMGLAALRYVRADGGEVESIQVLGMVSITPGFGEEMWVQLAGEAAGRGVGLWVRPAKNARKFYDEIGMTFEETPEGPECSWTAEQVTTVARQAEANTDYLLPPEATRLLPAFEDKYTETQPVNPASPNLDAQEPEGDKDWQDRYLWTDFVMGKWTKREKPDANRILGGEENQKGEVKPVDGADRVEELSAAWNGGTGLGAIRLSEAVVEAYGGEPIPASVIPKDYLDKFGDKAFERVPESEVLGMAPDERTRRLADQAAKDDRMLPGDFPFNLADLAEQVYDGTQLALEEAGIPLESMVRLYRGVQGDPSTLVPEGYDGGWVQTKLYALSPWTFSKAVAAAYATAPQEVGADPLPGSLVAADFPRDRVWSTWATGPGSREHFEFIVLGLEGIRGWLTRVERKGTPGPPEPPKEAKP